jgi:hypothetical protein
MLQGNFSVKSYKHNCDSVFFRTKMLQMPNSLSILEQCWQIRYALDAFLQGASNELLPTIQFEIHKKL